MKDMLQLIIESDKKARSQVEAMQKLKDHLQEDLAKKKAELHAEILLDTEEKTLEMKRQEEAKIARAKEKIDVQSNLINDELNSTSQKKHKGLTQDLIRRIHSEREG